MSEEDKGGGAQERTPEEREADLIDKIANLEQDKVNLVDEIKGERVKKQTAQEELDKLKEDPIAPTDAPDPEELVNRVLAKKEEASSKVALDEAIADMKTRHNEFSNESDPAGIMFSKFEAELEKFNLSGITTKEGYVNRLNEAYDFMNRGTKTEERTETYTGTPQVGSGEQEESNVSLDDAENRLIAELGWDKERFLKQKAKRPTYIASLLKYRN